MLQKTNNVEIKWSNGDFRPNIRIAPDKWTPFVPIISTQFDNDTDLQVPDDPVTVQPDWANGTFSPNDIVVQNNTS